MEIGIDSFAAATLSTDTEEPIHSDIALAHLLERIALADEVGLDVFGIGQHFRKEFLDSATSVILGCGGGPYQQHSPHQRCHRAQCR